MKRRSYEQMVRTGCRDRYVYYNEVITFLEQLTTRAVCSLWIGRSKPQIEKPAPMSRDEPIYRVFSDARAYGYPYSKFLDSEV